MNTLDPAVTSASAAVTIDDLTDAATVGAGIDLAYHDAMTLQSLPLRARRVIVRLGAVMVVFYTSNLRVRTHTKVREDLLAYVTFGPQTRGTMNGLPVRSGMMLAAAPQSEAAFVVEPGWEGLTFLVSTQVIGEHLAIRQRDRDFQPPQGVEALQVSEARARQLFDWGRRLVDTAVRDPPCSTTVRPNAARPRSN
jgi:AraC family ethanolamine operon transcriptional activator